MENYVFIFFTGNTNKAKEISQILGKEFPFLTVDPGQDIFDAEEIQAVSVEKVASKKLDASHSVLDKLIINNMLNIDLRGKNLILAVEDTGLGFESMGSYKDEGFFPGALIKFYYTSMKKDNKKICDTLHGSKAESITCIATVMISGNEVTKLSVLCGKIEGRVSNEPRGENGFDYDKLLEVYYKGKWNTYAELEDDQKNEISPRALALKQLKTMFKRLNVTFNNLHEFNEKTIRLK